MLSLNSTQRAVLFASLLALPLAAQGEPCSVPLPELEASDADTGDFFGDALSVDGERLVIGAEGSDDLGPFSGAAYVFERSGSDWTEVMRLPTPPLDPGDRFAATVSLSGDRIAVGADGDDEAGTDAGAVYIFDLVGGAWVETSKLTAVDATPAALFGKSVALDGDTLIVGAIRDDQNGQDAGAAYVYVENAGIWTQEAKLVASDGGTFSAFGNDVQVEADRLTVAAPEDDIDGSGAINDEVGAVYVFERTLGAWSEITKLVGSDSVERDRFGGSVGLSGDRIAVGAPGHDSVTTSSGAVYVFELDQGVWNEVGELFAADAAASDLLGIALDLDGDVIVAGAVFDDDGGNSSGSAYVFEDQGTGWAEALKLVASDAATGDRFGCTIALTGRTVLVASVEGDSSGAPNSGTVYPFALGHAATTYGMGLPGRGGLEPTLLQPTCPADRMDLVLEVGNGLGGTVGVLLVSPTPISVPAFGGTLLVAPPFLAQEAHVLSGSPGQAGAGATTFTFQAQTSSSGLVLYCQAGYLDAGAPGNVSLTAGLAVELP